MLASLALAIAVMLCAGCGEHQRFGDDPPIVYPTDHTVQPVVSPGVYGGSMTGTFLGDPKTLNLVVADDADTSALLGELYDSLEGRDPFTLKFKSRLAYLPKVSPDGLTYTYTLRPGLKWSDGYPITADDVIFTLNVLFDPTIQYLGREGLLVDVNQPDGTVKRVPFKYVKVNERTVKFILPVKWAPAEEIFGFNIVPKHVLEAAYNAGKFNSTWGVDTPPNQIVCSGPYKLASYTPGQRMVLVANPYFWRSINGQKLPYISKFNYLIIPDTNGMVLNFRAGGSDTIAPIPNLQYPTIAEYAKRDNYTVIDRGYDWGFSYLSFNENPHSALNKRLLKIFSDVRFRQACSYAIDRNALCDDILSGLAEPDYSPETPSDVQYYDPNVKRYDYDPAKARSLLLSMGMTPGRNGMLLYEGQPVSFNILTNTENHLRIALATVISNELQAIGLDAHFTPVEFNALITRLDAPPYDWQAIVMGFTGGPEPNDGSDIWRSGGEDHDWWPYQPKPATPWEARIDRDFTNGAHELDLVKRKKYYDDWQETLGIEQPLIFLLTQHDYSAVRNRFGNIEPSAFYSFTGDVYWNLEEEYRTRTPGYTR
jgi:peptide/nickel transport system substrate-binding protein